MVATLIDWLIYGFLADVYCSKVKANLFSRSTGMLVNFFMQKKLVFHMKRDAWLTFALTIAVSLFGLLLGTLIMKAIGDWQIWKTYPQLKMAPKLIETGILFFYNFYLKRYVFEKKFF